MRTTQSRRLDFDDSGGQSELKTGCEDSRGSCRNWFLSIISFRVETGMSFMLSLDMHTVRFVFVRALRKAVLA